MSRQTSRSEYTREEAGPRWQEDAERGRRERVDARHGMRQDEERDPRDSGRRGSEQDEGYDGGYRRGYERGYGGSYDRGSPGGGSWRGAAGRGRGDASERWETQDRGGRQGSWSERSAHDEDNGRGGWYGEQDEAGWRSRERGEGWDRSAQIARDEDNDPRPYYTGRYRSSAQPFSYEGGSGMFVAESFSMTGPFTGKGPKGYKRSGERLKEEVCDRLERQGDIDASEIEVECKDGIVTLKGKVRDRRTKRRAEEVVEDLYGVDDVMNELRIDKKAFEGSTSASSSSSSSEQQRNRASGGERKS